LKEAASSVSSTKDAKTKICAVARKRIDGDGRGNSYIRLTAYGFKWEYDEGETFEGERWKSIPADIVKGVEGYKISTLGRIQNHKGRIGDPYKGTAGYMWLRVSPSAYQAHRLVGLVFLENPNNYPVINHIDGDKSNCRVENLEWCSHSMNSQHAHDTLLNKTGKTVKQIGLDGYTINIFKNAKIASQTTGICYSSICNVASGSQITAGSFKWEYV
jgi:hypothetical protein